MNNNSNDSFFASKQDCHAKTEKVYDDWETCLRTLMVNKSYDVHEETLKTAKLFAQVDSLSKNTQFSLERTGKVLDQLLDKKLGILATTKNLNEIQSLLDLNTTTKNYWQATSASAIPSKQQEQEENEQIDQSVEDQQLASE